MMAQRDYERQPEAADIAGAVQDDTAETLIGPPADRAFADAARDGAGHGEPR